MTQQPPDSAWHRKALYGLTNLALFLAGIATLVAGVLAAYSGSAAIAATALTGGLVLLFAATIDRFESLKGLGIEAKTRQLDNKISEADEMLRRLREMTELTSSSLISLNSKLGRWDSAPTPRESYSFVEKVRSIMASVGSSPTTIAATLKPWAAITCRDMAAFQAGKIDELVSERLKVLEQERQRIPSPMSPTDPKLLDLSVRINAIHTYRKAHIQNLHRLSLDDYPDRFMAMFENVPEVDPKDIAPLRVHAARFSNGMRSLVRDQTLTDPESWLDEVSKAWEKQGD